MRAHVDRSSAEKKLVSYLIKKNSDLDEKELSSLLNSIKRFVNLTRRIYTEPQARVTYRDRKEGDKNIKDRIFTADKEELAKVIEKPEEPFIEVVRKFHKAVTKK